MDKNNPEFKVPQELKHYLAIEDKYLENNDDTKSPETLQNSGATSSIAPNILTDTLKLRSVD